MANYTIAVLQTLQEGFSFVSFQFPPEGGNGASNRLQVTGGDTITFDPGNIQSGSISIGAVEGFTNNTTIVLTSGGANVVREVSSVFNGPAEIDAQSDGFSDVLYLNVANASDVTTVDITDRIVATDTVIDAQEGTHSTIPVTVTISNPSQSSYYWNIGRISGTVGDGEFGAPTSGTPTLDGNNQFSVSLNLTNDTVDETGYQGEEFVFRVYTSNGGTLLGSESFILYDNDLQVTVSESTITIVDPDALTFPITINNNGVAGGQDARIFITTTGFEGSIAFPTIPAASGSSTVNIPTSWVPDGQTRDFRLDVKYASFGYLTGADTFTVSKALVDVTTPTSIFYTTAGTAAADTTVEVTASGGGDGTLEVSANNSDWFANGSSFNVTRGSTYTFYARSNYNSEEIVSSVLTDTDGYTAPYISPSIATHTPAGPIGANQDGYTFGLTNATATTNAYRVSYDTVDNQSDLIATGGTLVSWTPYSAVTKTLTNAQLPTVGNSTGYRIWSFRYSNVGGSGAYELVNTSDFTISRSSYVTPETSITVSTNSPVAFSATTHNVTISNNADDVTVYELRSGSYSGTVLATVTGNGTASSVTGAAGTYYITAYVPTADDGQGTAGRVNVTTYAITQTGADTTPSQFDLGANVTGATLNQVVLRNFAVAGVDAGVDITFTADTAATKVSTNNSTWVDSITRQLGQTVYVRGTASGSYNDPVTVQVSSGSVTDSFTITTALATPETSITVSTNSPIAFGGTTHNVTVSNNADGITVYRIRSASYTGSVLGTITGNGTANGLTGGAGTYYVTAYVPTTDGGAGTSGEVNVTTYTVSQSAADITPESYTALAGNVTNAPLSTTYYATFSGTTASTSSPGTGFSLSGQIETDVTATATNGQLSTNGTNWVTTATVSSSDTVYFRTTSSGSNSITTQPTLVIGDTTRSFTISTVAGSGGGSSGGTSAYGLELYDANGDLVFGTSDRAAFLLERLGVTVSGSGGTYSKTYNVPIMAAIPTQGFTFAGTFPMPISVSVSGNTVTITNNTGFPSQYVEVLVISGG